MSTRGFQWPPAGVNLPIAIIDADDVVAAFRAACVRIRPSNDDTGGEGWAADQADQFERAAWHYWSVANDALRNFELRRALNPNAPGEDRRADSEVLSIATEMWVAVADAVEALDRALQADEKLYVASHFRDSCPGAVADVLNFYIDNRPRNPGILAAMEELAPFQGLTIQLAQRAEQAVGSGRRGRPLIPAECVALIGDLADIFEKATGAAAELSKPSGRIHAENGPRVKPSPFLKFARSLLASARIEMPDNRILNSLKRSRDSRCGN